VKLLVVIAGPIGAGKSTVADLLARQLAKAGMSAAVVDLDEVAFMQREIDLHRLWRRGAIAARALVQGWFDAETDAVVAHGPFFESGGYEVLLAGHHEVTVRQVLLRVSYETALRRVSGDSGRDLSRDPAFLKATHDRFRELERTMPEPHFVFDTEARTAAEIATELGSAVVGS
jgi:thymidylate kinase